MKKIEHVLENIARAISKVANSPWMDLFMYLSVLFWIMGIPLWGEQWHFWGDVILASAALLMFFVIQTTGAIEARAVQAKLDEILAKIDKDDPLIAVDENVSADDLETIREEQQRAIQKTQETSGGY